MYKVKMYVSELRRSTSSLRGKHPESDLQTNLKANSEMDQMLQNSVNRWVLLTSTANNCRLSITTGNLSQIATGPLIDEQETLKEGELLKVYLSSAAGTASLTNEQTIFECEGHIIDVPSDGNCGFHAMCRASFHYGGTTFLGTSMPSSMQDSRAVLVQFIQRYRHEIEDVVVAKFGARTARSYLWNDVGGQAGPGSPVSHSQLCASLVTAGITGHWLGAGVGELEIHLLGRVLGVTLHCVMAASYGENGHCLRQTFGPYSCLWTGPLQGTPKGAVVIRYLGSYSCGHYQFVRCGRKPERIRNPIPSQYCRNNRKKRERTFDDNELQRDLTAVDDMHGVQPQTKKRYSTDYALVDRTFRSLMDANIDPLELESNGARVVKALMAILLRRCGPREKGYENLSAKATGKVILAAVGNWYKDHGKSFNDNHTTVVTGKSVRGPPWKAQQVLEFKQTLLKMQAKSRTVLERKAYQLTHDDVAAAMRYSVAQQLGAALDTSYPPGTNPNVNWMKLQVALMVTAAFGSGCRGAEMTSILLGDLKFLYEGADTTVGVTLYGVKSKNGYRAIRRIVFPAWSDTCIISPSFAILTQISLVHGLLFASGMNNAESPLYPNIHRNQVLRGQRMPADTYNSALKELFRELEITDNATEHSPRRGGSGFRYYVLGEHPNYIRDILGHANTAEALNYIGFEDSESSYVIQGYGTCGTKKIR